MAEDGSERENNVGLASMDSTESRGVFQDDEEDVPPRATLDSEEEDNAEQRLIRTGPRIDSFDVEALEVPSAPRNDYEMGGKGANCVDAKDWRAKHQFEFIRILNQYVKDNKMQTSTFKQKLWEEIDDQLEKVVRVRYGVDGLKSKFNRLRRLHREFSELINHTGTTYNPETNIVEAAEEVWQMFYVKNTVFKQFRKKGLEHYGLLGEIFNNTTATGELHHASTQKPITSDEERALENDFISKGVHVDLCDVGDTMGENDIDYQFRGNTNEGTKRKAGSTPGESFSKKENKKAKMDLVMEALLLALSYKRKVNQAKFEKLKAVSETSDPYSVEECMDLLESIDGLETCYYNKALEKLHDPVWRKMFVKMSAVRRMKWLESL